MDDEKILEICITALKASERRIAETAARFAVNETCAYLQSVGVLDDRGQPHPNQRLKVRIIDPRCYPPLWVQ